MNPKAIRVKEKKKLRTVTQELNKKTGQYELQIKEGGCIVQREDMDHWRNRFYEEYIAPLEEKDLNNS
jgi:hypothetical protein